MGKRLLSCLLRFPQCVLPENWCFFFVMVFFIMCNKSSLIKLVRSWASPYWLIISPFSNTVFLGLSRTPLQIMSAKEATCCVPVYKICKKNITCSACAFYILMQQDILSDKNIEICVVFAKVVICIVTMVTTVSLLATIYNQTQ